MPTVFLVYSAELPVVLDGHALMVRHVATETLLNRPGLFHRIEVHQQLKDKPVPVAYLRPRNWKPVYPGSRSTLRACGYTFVGAVDAEGKLLPPEVVE